MFVSETHVKIERAIVTWDGLTQPERKDDGTISHNIGFAVSQTDPAYNELNQIVQASLDNSDFKGTLPAGANPALKPADVAKFGAILTGHQLGNASTMRGLPPVFDEQGKQLSIDQLSGVLFPGCVVSLLVHAYTYNNKQRGVKFGIDGVQIVDRAAPKLDVAAGMAVSEVANVFGAQSVTATVPQAPATVTPPPPTVPQAPATVTPPPPPADDLASGKIMLPAAQGIPYEEYIKGGWTDEKLIAQGFMQG